MKSLVNRFRKNESGATAIEYGLIAALISVFIIGALQLAGTELNTTFTKIKDTLSTANSASSGTGGAGGGTGG